MRQVRQGEPGFTAVPRWRPKPSIERERGRSSMRVTFVSQAPGLSGNSQRSSEPNRRCNALQIGGLARISSVEKHLSERQHPRFAQTN
jgi:hypothetical protein